MTNSDKARLMVEMANGALRLGDPIAALSNLARAEAIDPTLPEIYHSKALAFNAKRNPALARTEVEKALKILPEYPAAQNTLGKLLMDEGRYEEAKPYLKKAANNPLYYDGFRAVTALGIISYRTNAYQEARSYFDRAIEAAPEMACIAYFYRGHLHLKDQEYSTAIKDYHHSTRRSCAAFVDGHFALGLAYEKDKQYDMARKKFLEIQQNFPNSKLVEQAMNHLKKLP